MTCCGCVTAGSWTRGDPQRVVDAYLSYVAGGEDTRLKEQQAAAAAALPETSEQEDELDAAPSRGGYRPGRWGGREVEITGVRLLDRNRRERLVFVPGETVTLELSVRAAEPVEDFVFGLGLFSAEGVHIYGTNTDLEEYTSRRLEGEGQVRLVLEDLRLVEGTYFVDVAAHRRDGTPYDYHRGLYSFRVKSRLRDVGLYRPAHHWGFEGGIAVDAPAPRGELDLSEEPAD